MVYKPISVSPLAPEDIRRIRERLGLTQVEAGELLGGGLRAFQKYESGKVAPAAPTANLLRLLEADPRTLEALTGRPAKALEAQGLRPFEVSGAHVAVLSDRKLVALLRRLLTAEALSNNIPRLGIHVASNVTEPDGGEDAHISWVGGPERTDFLPARSCLFQLKATDISPSEAAADVLTSNKEIEPAIKDLLASDGVYLMLCSRPSVRKKIAARENAVRKVIRERGLSIDDRQIRFADADQIATWVNAHPAVATWVLEQTQPGLAGPFRTWSHWAGRYEHERIGFVPDPRLADLRAFLRARIYSPRSVARLVGASGIGKSRLALEALGPTDEEEEARIALSDLVLYADETEVGAFGVTTAVQTLVDLCVRAVVVVDRCAAETHRTLAAMALRSGSKLSLLTIDHEIPPHRGSDTFELEKAPHEITEGILKAVAPGLASQDQRRLARFVSGYPQMATMVGDAWLADIPVATATDQALIDRIVIGRKALSPEKTVKAAMLVSALGLLGYREKVEEELTAAAPLTGLAQHDLKAALEELRQRGVVQLRGRYASLEPRPIATSLAERQWREWGPATWDKLLADKTAPFAVRLADRLALLNDSGTAHEIAQHLCRRGGPLDSAAAIKVESNATVIASLSEIDGPAVAGLLDRVLGAMSRDELREIAEQDRRQIVHAVQNIAFAPETFEEGANLMMRLALAENETWGNNATGQFCHLFRVMLGETAAGGNARLAMLDSALTTNDQDQLMLLVGALSNGVKTSFFSRMEGSESQGLRPALQPWLPTTREEANDYVGGCFERLLRLAVRGDAVGSRARTVIAGEFRALTSAGFLDGIERAVREITAVHGRSWPDALSSLGDVLLYDLEGLSQKDQARVRALMQVLSPQDLAARLQLLVTEMPWDYPCDGPLDFDVMQRRQREAIEQLVDDLLAQPSELKKALGPISRGSQRMAVAFGKALAGRAPEPLKWRWPILMAFRRAPEGERNADVLAGYYIGLAPREPGAVASFKRAALASSLFARIVPFIAWAIGLTVDDVELVRIALKSGTLKASSLHYWTTGGELAKLPPDAVAPLFADLLSSTPDAWNLAVNLMGMYVHGDPSRLEKLRPEIRRMADTAGVEANRSDSMSNHHFGQIMTWILKCGSDDDDARGVALSLSRAIVARAESDSLIGEQRIKPLIPILLRSYPEIVWSLISKAIVADPKSAWRFEFALSERTISSNGGKTSVLLNLSVDTLFAWCHAFPEVGPAFLASTIPVLGSADESGNCVLHPIIKRLVDEFGAREDVQHAIVRNIYTFGWMGSTADYYRRYLAPFTELARHRDGGLRQWAKKIVEGLNRQIAADKQEDDERDAFWDH